MSKFNFALVSLAQISVINAQAMPAREVTHAQRTDGTYTNDNFPLDPVPPTGAKNQQLTEAQRNAMKFQDFVPTDCGGCVDACRVGSTDSKIVDICLRTVECDLLCDATLANDVREAVRAEAAALDMMEEMQDL